MGVKEFIENAKSGSIDIVEHTHRVLDESKKLAKEYNYFNTVSEELALELANNIKKSIKSKDSRIKNKKLFGLPISIKDSICVKGVESTAGSRILKGYRPLFNATVVERAINEGAIIIGKTSQDEFGFGSFSVNIGLGFKTPKNPVDPERSCGGSSGGAAGLAKKASFPHIAIGESTGGSIAEPASFCDIFGLTPTYGRNSRYGNIDFGNSLDKLGTLGKTCYDVALLEEVIAGHDINDSTTINAPVDRYSDLNKKNAKKMRIAVIKESFTEGLGPAVEKKVWGGIKKLESEGIKYEEISLEMPIRYGLAAYYMIGTSEASTNLAKFCGMRYGNESELEGNFNQYFTKIRSSHFSEEAKRRIILGTFARMSGYRDAYYIKAMQIRALMTREYKKAFKKYDALVSPTVPILPPKFTEIAKLTPLQNYMMDVMLVGPNVCGLPHLNVPVGYEKALPVGMLLTGDHLQEKKLLGLGNLFEEEDV